MGLKLSHASGSCVGYESADSAQDIECQNVGPNGSPLAADDPRRVYDQAGMELMYLNAKGARRDQVLRQLYVYWKDKGFQCIVADKVLHIVRCCFAIAFTFLLSFYIDWSETLSCAQKNGKRCHIFKGFYQDLNGIRYFILFLEVCFATSVAVYVLRLLIVDLRTLLKTKRFYEKQLRISENDVYFGLKTWGFVASRLKQWQERTVANRFTPEDPVVLDELAIAQCILRERNYVTALFNSGLIRLPLLNQTTVTIVETMVIGYMLGWGKNTLHITRNALDREQKVRGLRMLLYFGAAAMVLLSPILLAWKVLYSAFRHGLVLREEPGRLATRQWSIHANLLFREFNELDHVFRLRMKRALKISQEYIQTYPYHFERILALSITFFVTGVIGFIVVICLVNENAYSFEVAGRPLFWWLPVASAVAVLSGKMAKTDAGDRAENGMFDPVAGFKAIANCTHWRPEGWNRSSDHVRVFGYFKKRFFPLTVSCLATEALSVVTTPYHLVFCLAPQMELIVEFMLDCTVAAAGVGDIVAFSTFDFEKYASAAYRIRVGSSQTITQYCQNGKMEVSFLNFCTLHAPLYVPPQVALAAISGVVQDANFMLVDTDNTQGSGKRALQRALAGGYYSDSDEETAEGGATSSSRGRQGKRKPSPAGGGGGGASRTLTGSDWCDVGGRRTASSQLDRVADMYSALEDARTAERSGTGRPRNDRPAQDE
eukprot:TRINITY_DN19347_c0_g2_i1.p1 TRINITY_DN19347_c0_g2~~TRINITY_DN19347_c0_g2_i1.p1  ORF type:complete len:724 (+),score=291.66 TRINITY_DN19347_c0_g2_i1:30-2174(+)